MKTIRKKAIRRKMMRKKRKRKKRRKKSLSQSQNHLEDNLTLTSRVKT